MAASYTQQEDVDLAFADYDRAMLIVCPRPAHVSRNTLLCRNCGSPNFTYNNSGGSEPGARVCNECGAVAAGPIIFETMFGRDMPIRSSNYKRIHHFHERISQLLLMESQIPSEHMLQIGTRLLDGSLTCISKDAIRAVLRSLGMQVYIEKWLQIIERTTGVKPPCPGAVILQRLDALFVELQRPFVACKPDSRRNFLNYNYIFCRLFQKMNCEKFCMFFPLIRSKAKLKVLDTTWEAMAQSLGWEVAPLPLVEEFAVQIDQPAELLSQLEASVASSCSAVLRKAPMKTAIQTWDPSRAAKHKRQPRFRSPLPERRPQALSLRLKRKRTDREKVPRLSTPSKAPQLRL